MRENMDQKKLLIWTLFTQCYLLQYFIIASTEIMMINNILCTEGGELIENLKGTLIINLRNYLRNRSHSHLYKYLN